MLSALFSIRGLSISAIAVAVFTLYQFIDSKWKSRIEHSLDYTIRYQEPEKVHARIASDLWQRIARDTENENIIEEVKEKELPTSTRLDSVKSSCFASVSEFKDKLSNEHPDFVAELGAKEDLFDYGYRVEWPKVLRQFWMEEEGERYLTCLEFIDNFEREMARKTVDGASVLSEVHELKQFYAAASICATSGICDSQVACELFRADMIDFTKQWGEYFELWSPSQGRNEYWRVGDFIKHCNKKLFNRRGTNNEGLLDWSFLALTGYFNVWPWLDDEEYE